MVAALIPDAAAACDCVRLLPESPRFQADLDRIAAFYPVAAEGVLEVAGPYAWRFRPTQEYRGPGEQAYPIDLISDCSLAPDELRALLGKPVFVLLSGSGNHYEISRCVNFLGRDIDAAIRTRIEGGCKTR
jgi:hypothetical protein